MRQLLHIVMNTQPDRLLTALRELSKGRPNIAHDILLEAVDLETDLGFTAARALNWLESGCVLHAKVLLAKTLSEIPNANPPLRGTANERRATV